MISACVTCNRKIEEKRGVTVNDSGIPEVKPHSTANGVPFQSLTQTPEKVASAAKSSPAWDEDWGSPSKDFAVGNHASSHQVTNNQFNKSSNQSQPLQNKATAPTTCPPVDIEWPPRQSSSLTTPAIADETQLNTGTSSTPGFDELDPFANWPPRPKTPNNGASVASTGLNNGTASGSNNLTSGTPFQTANNDHWAFSNSSVSSLKPHQQRQTQGMPSFSSGSNNNEKPADISSIFSSSKTGQPAMKLTPPPSTTMGRGRGRGRGGTSKPNGSQTSLLDLL